MKGTLILTLIAFICVGGLILAAKETTFSVPTLSEVTKKATQGEEK